MAESSSVGFEFCISAGEGTLLDYGVMGAELPFMVGSICIDEVIQDTLEYGNTISIANEHEGERKIAFRPAPPDCQTGK